MKANRCTVEQLKQALQETNKKYDDNIIFYPSIRSLKRFRLYTKDSHRKGARLHIHYRDPFGDIKRIERHGRSACWHVHGDFFEALFVISPDAVIYSRGRKITRDKGNWIDENMGTNLLPVMYSESCECNNN